MTRKKSDKSAPLPRQPGYAVEVGPEDTIRLLKNRLEWVEGKNGELVSEAKEMYAKVKLLRQMNRTTYTSLLEFSDDILPVESPDLSPILNSLAEQNRKNRD